MPAIKFVLPLLAALGLAAPALAQDTPLTRENGHLVLRAEGHELSLPMPDWVDPAGDWNALVSEDWTELDGQAQLEIYPRGEGQAFWSRLYGARLTLLPDPALADFRALSMEIYASSCRPDAIAFFQLEADAGDAIPPLGFVCGSYRDPLIADEGEVTIMAFYKSDTGIAMLYRGWRGPAFDPARTESWPVTSAEVEAQVDRFNNDVTLSRAD